ncbi:hypothetical protein [Nocardiopsis rhodophaea]|uniref:hypothetical protein n=1 Tax=Nocardiopsis rhodophaea TaxID=280238 RepID=UPI0031E05984
MIFVVATVVAAVMSFGLPTHITSQVSAGLCRIAGDPDCEPLDGEETSTGASSDRRESASEDGSDEKPKEGSPKEENSTQKTDTAVYDPAAAQGLVDAHAALQKSKKKQEEAESDYSNLDKELLNLLSELLGIEDARKCLTEGDIVACIWTVVGFTPWGKGAKVVKKIPKIAKLFSRWRKLKKAKEAADKKFQQTKKKTENALADCGEPKPKSRNYTIDARVKRITKIRQNRSNLQELNQSIFNSYASARFQYIAPLKDDKKPNLDDLLAQADKEGKSTPSLDDLLAGTEGTWCENPNPESNPGEITQLHTEGAMNERTLKGLRDTGTDDIMKSLKPGQEESLKVRPDGTIVNGNHRIKVLKERGVDVDSLPREIVRKHLPEDGYWD